MEAVPDKRIESEFTPLEEETYRDTSGQSPDQDLAESEFDSDDLSLRHSAFGPNIYGYFDF